MLLHKERYQKNVVYIPQAGICENVGQQLSYHVPRCPCLRWGCIITLLQAVGWGVRPLGSRSCADTPPLQSLQFLQSLTILTHPPYNLYTPYNPFRRILHQWKGLPRPLWKHTYYKKCWNLFCEMNLCGLTQYSVTCDRIYYNPIIIMFI